ncbi:hypothetical protein EVG20_g10884 [Dentipellis fragilis]|uniref:G-protein coupled receptors family 1 profile domain-containing protein n=1 Tax=Dentipellis fragilis TaxID=205917 RepID=A0A4Y9XPL1_9AGAM|nr:hypothetical protein EVG20_g10884 [Dentipellis fragilis]
MMDDAQRFDERYNAAIQQHVPVILTGTILYGINLSLSSTAAIMLLREGTGERSRLQRVWLLSMLVLMVLFATAYIVLDTLVCYVWLSHVVGRYLLAQHLLFIMQSALGDSVTIWRCYVLYEKSIIAVVLPGSTAFASFTLGVYFVSIEWGRNTWIWAAITMFCTVYCAVVISCKIYSSARLSRSTNLFAAIFFIIETSLIYALSIVAYLVTAFTSQFTDSGMAAWTIIMSATVQLPPIVLCLLILQIKFYNRDRQTVQFMNSETVRPRVALRHIVRIERDTRADDQSMPTFQMVPIVIREPMHTMSTEARIDLEAYDTSDVDEANEKREKSVPIVTDIV